MIILYENCFTSSFENLMKVKFPSLYESVTTVSGINILPSQVYCTDFVHAKLDICVFSNHMKISRNMATKDKINIGFHPKRLETINILQQEGS